MVKLRRPTPSVGIRAARSFVVRKRRARRMPHSRTALAMAAVDERMAWMSVMMRVESSSASCGTIAIIQLCVKPVEGKIGDGSGNNGAAGNHVGIPVNLIKIIYRFSHPGPFLNSTIYLRSVRTSPCQDWSPQHAKSNVQKFFFSFSFAVCAIVRTRLSILCSIRRFNSLIYSSIRVLQF